LENLAVKRDDAIDMSRTSSGEDMFLCSFYCFIYIYYMNQNINHTLITLTGENILPTRGKVPIVLET